MAKFNNIHLYLKKNYQNELSHPILTETRLIVEQIIEVLVQRNCTFNLDINSHKLLQQNSNFYANFITNNIKYQHLKPDLIIVIGGDGSLLHVIRENVDLSAPILGINKGKLGFLADLNPPQIKRALTNILKGEFIEEERSLLQAEILHHHSTTTYKAVNDVVLYNGKIPKLMEFEVIVDQQVLYTQKADGLVVATPTGSTAYSLSAGGPILCPNLKVISLIALYPHTLKTRPIVVGENSVITLKIINYSSNIEYGLNFDGQENILLEPSDTILIKKYHKNFKLIHPKNYNYFQVLREKLSWH